MTSADYFLLLDGIPGESPDRAHPNEIEAFGFSWGETLTSTIGHGGGMGVGKVAMTALVVQAPTSIATPHLMVACASGRCCDTLMVMSSKVNEISSVGRWSDSPACTLSALTRTCFRVITR